MNHWSFAVSVPILLAGSAVLLVAFPRGLVASAWLQVVPAAAAGLCYTTAAAVGGSGFIAAFVGGDDATFGDNDQVQNIYNLRGERALSQNHVPHRAVLSPVFELPFGKGRKWLNGNGPLWIDYAALVSIGFLIYGPIMIVGLHALDLVPKQAAGTAAGFTGFFGYVFGSAIAGTGVGWIADHWGWNGVFMTMVACCVLTIGFSTMTLGHRAESAARRE